MKDITETLLVAIAFLMDVKLGIAFAAGVVIGALLTMTTKAFASAHLDARFWVGVAMAVVFAIIHTWVKELPFLLLMLPPALVGIDAKYFQVWKK